MLDGTLDHVGVERDEVLLDGVMDVLVDGILVLWLSDGDPYVEMGGVLMAILLCELQ